LCQELGRRTHDAVDQWEDQLALLDQDLQSDPKWLESFELPPDAMAALQVLAQLGGTEIAGEDLDAGLDPAFADPSFVESLLYSEPRGDRRLSMNSALGRLLGGRGSR
jgi:hypothetical protein